MFRPAYIVLLAALAAGCAAPDRSSDTPRAPQGGTTGSEASGSTSGPHEGERASTPPGTSRAGTPPSGGAILDPTGAVTKTPPPEGMR